ESQITAQNIHLSSLNSQLFFLDKLEPLNAKINLTAPINAIFPSDKISSVKADAISINIGKQNLTANGNLLLSNLWKNPDIKEVNLNVNTQINLETLPLTKLLAKIPVNRNLLSQTIDLTGQGKFKGKLVARNLLTDPLSLKNLQLIGDLSLSNFSINNRLFDPIISGKIKIESSDKISINLRGKQDIIAADLTTCKLQKCLFPYLLNSFEIQQIAKTSNPIIAQGKYENDRLVAKVQNFPLELLRISPISNYGIPDYLGGQLNINLDFNPSTLNLGGNLSLSNPKLGKIVGDKFTTSWVYQDNRVVLDNTTLKIGNSSYNVAGALNLKSGNIEGKLDVKEGYIQDILTALNLSDWDSLLRLLNLRDNIFTTAEQINPKPMGNIDDTVAEQVNSFWQNDRIIKDIVVARNSGDLPRKLNMRGKFNAGITLSGNLKEPQLTVKLEGNKWQWTPQPSIPSIINPLGLVIEGAQIIPIEKIDIQGQLENGIIKLKPTIEVGQTLAQGTLNLSYKNNQFYIEPSDFKVEKLTLDLVRSLIVIPEDINGLVKLEGVLQGSLINPEMKGKFEFNDGSVYARLLNQDLGGEFSYGQDKLKVKMTNPDFIQLNALVPFPIDNNNNNDFTINAKIGTEAFSLLEPLTQGQIVWDGGKGEININVNGKVTVYDKLKISLNPDSKITLNLENGTFNSELLPIPVTLNSQIILQNGYFQVKELTAEVATRVLTAQGSLPLFPLSPKATPNPTPLTLNINEESINLNGIYEGLIDGKIVIDGALISPVIGGKLRFSKGQLVVPTFPKQQANSPIFESWVGTFTPNNGIISSPRLNDFKISIDEVGIDQKKINPKFYFNVSGDITFNGKLSNLSFAEIFALEPSGTVKVNTGKIDIPVTRVFFSSKQDNTLTFLPQDGLLNPYLNLELKFYLLLVGLQSIKDNEIPDDILQNSRARSAEVTLGIKGSASQLLPNLGQQLEQVCQFTRTDNRPIPSSPTISNSLLTQIAKCIEVNNLGTNSIGDLVQSPIVTVTSNPPLTNSQLFALFGSQLPDFIAEKQQQNSTQLLQIGVPQVAVVLLPFLQDWIFQMNETTDDIGDSIGLPNLSIYPVLQTVYELDNKALVRFSYNYSINEATIRYETKF
ncbi:translocation/assembly module TamB domain-containing protein, partial [Aphanothece sacrum]